MFDQGAEILPGMTVLHDDGLTYRVDRVDQSTDEYETRHRLSGLLRIAYTQLENGDYPAGTGWNKLKRNLDYISHPSQQGNSYNNPKQLRGLF